MILYHGSYTAIEKPDLALSRPRTDFGKGFYLTPLKEQAELSVLPQKPDADRQSSDIPRIGGDQMTANRTLIGHKCSNVIRAYAEVAGIPLRQAFDTFYRSKLYTEIIDGISDMHCRSDGYLAEELQLELLRAKPQRPSRETP